MTTSKVNSSSQARPLPDGVYVPVVTFFNDDATQSLDLETHAAHIKWLIDAGVSGIAVQGSSGEAPTLDRNERDTITRLTRKVLDTARPGERIPLIVGTVGAQSTGQAIQLSEDAAQSGGDYVLVLPPAYYASAMSTSDIKQFYIDVANASPIPVLIYSYPAVSGGIDMDTDLLASLAVHPNIVGIKHTDHSLSKQARLASLRHTFGTFSVLGGASDYLLASLSVGAQGFITGMGNVTPRTIVKAYEAFKAGNKEEALELSGQVARGEWALGKGGLTGVKYAVAYHNGLPIHSAYPRKPLALTSKTSQGWQETELKDVIAIERKLEQEAGYEGAPYGKTLGNKV